MAANLRQLTIDDYDAVINLWLGAGLPIKPKGRDSRPMMAKEMARDYCAYFGLYDDDLMVGVGIANYDGRRGWINRVAIDPDRRGERLAGLIITACEEFLKGLGSVVNCALIEEINSPSISCFQNAGYHHEPVILYFTSRSSPDA